MKENTAPPVPQLYAILVDLVREIDSDTDPFLTVPFTQQFELAPRPPGPPTTPRLRTHEEYQRDRMRAWRSDPPVELALSVGAWVPDRLLDDEDAIVVDINTIVASERLRR